MILAFLVIVMAAGKPLSGLWFSLALAAMILSAMTDLFDGYYARKFKVVTRLGGHADPLTDKVFYAVTLPAMVFLAMHGGQIVMANILLIFTVVYLLRDLWVTFLRSIGAMYQISGKANWSGKARTFISFPVICVIFYYLQAPKNWALQIPTVVVYALIAVTLIINVVSIWVYTRQYWPCLQQEMTVEE